MNTPQAALPIDDAQAAGRVPRWLRAVTWAECGVVLFAALLLGLAPALSRDIWAWQIAPFNARFVSATYAAALLPLTTFALGGRWVPGRVVLTMIFTFTTLVMLAMLMHAGSFDWSRPAAPIFWFLYLFLPINSVIFIWRLRRRPAPATTVTLPIGPAVGYLAAAALALYGLALMALPQTAAAFWPWPVDAFHARIYAAAFVTPAVGIAMLLHRAARPELVCVARLLVAFGLCWTISVLITDQQVPAARRIDYGRPGVWAWFATNAAFVACGAWLMRGRSSRP